MFAIGTRPLVGALLFEDLLLDASRSDHPPDDWRQRLARAEQLESNFAAELEKARLELAYNLAYGAGHDINNPLANISSRAQSLAREERDPEKRRKLAAIQAQAQRAHEMLVDLMLFARPPKLERKPTDLAAIAAEVVAELQSRAADQGTKLVAATEPTPLHADATQLAVAIRALVVNAIEAVARMGEVRVEVRSLASVGGEVIVSDNGPGISPEVRPKIFDPFFSGREAGRGLGFGLCKVWRIVTSHGGRVEVESQPGEGATFRLYLPVTDE